MFIFLMTAISITAVPTGPTNIDVISSERYPVTSASNLSAVAGNVTEVNFMSNAITQTWQGYFGNISGTILLGNSNNQTMYNWNSASPSGQIYATRNTLVPSWGVIRCANITDVAAEEVALGVNPAIDSDSVNRTFTNVTNFNPFFVGSININTTQNCYAVNLHNSTSQPDERFSEVLLHDNVELVYTALLTSDTFGFDNRTHDFEMIVGEDGHSGDTASTLYYFYLELN